MGWFLERARALGVEHRPPARIVLGRHLIDLGVAPGPEMGRLLNQLYERQLDGEFDSIEKGLELARELVHVGRD
jgi:tRNA nucleotidyltransferase (CCA-adding enzyme)